MDYCNIDYCISGFADILLGIINFANHLFQNPATAIHPGVFECLRLCFQIIHSFNSIDLHDKFKPVIGQWMSSFLSILTSSYPTADGRLDLLRATICDNLQLFTDKYGDADVVSKNLGYSVTAVLGCLMSSTAGVQLLVSGIKFITAVAESTHRVLLESAMEGIYNRVIIPNLQLRDEDEYLFNGNWIEYVRLDSEVSDTDTPRRAACQLLGVLATNYRGQVDKFVSYMWNSYRADLANNWKQNDAVIHLILALGKILGGPEVDSFFTSVVQPELLSVSDHLSVPMLKATALRFLKEFIDQISIDKVRVMLPHMVRFLNYDSSVVHSYAAIFIESLSNMDDAAFVPKVTSQIIQSFWKAISS